MGGLLGSRACGTPAALTCCVESHDERAEPALLRTLAEGHPSLEARQRMEEILQKIPQPGLEQMRTLRAIQVLEHIGTSEARRLLKELAQGAAEAVETPTVRLATSNANVRIFFTIDLFDL